MNDLTKNILVFIVIIVVLLSVVQGLSGVSGPAPEKTDYSEFLKQVKSGNVQRAEFDGKRINYGNRTPLGYYTISPETDNNTLIGILEENNVRFTAQEPESQSLIGQLLISSFPILLLIGVWIYFMRQMQGGGGGRGALSRQARRPQPGPRDGLTFAGPMQPAPVPRWLGLATTKGRSPGPSSNSAAHASDHCVTVSRIAVPVGVAGMRLNMTWLPPDPSGNSGHDPRPCDSTGSARPVAACAPSGPIQRNQ